MNLILSGSVLSLMKKLFEKRNLRNLYSFGRANERIYLKPFTIDTLKKIISDHNKDYKTNRPLRFLFIYGRSSEVRRVTG